MSAKKCWAAFVRMFMGNLLTILLLIAVTLGVVMGIVVKMIAGEISPREGMYVSFPGDIMLNMLKYVALPLVVTCLVTAIGSLDLQVSRRMGWQVIVLMLAMQTIGAVIGLVLAILIQPGSYGDVAKQKEKDFSIRKTTTPDTFLDLFRNAFPRNVIGMFFLSEYTPLSPPDGDESAEAEQWIVEERSFIVSPNMLGIVCISVAVGISVSIRSKEAQPIGNFAAMVGAVVMKVTIWILWISPAMLMFLIMGQILKTKHLLAIFTSFGMYFAVFYLACLIHILLTVPLTYFLFVRANPFVYYRKIMSALVTAFATSSSLASMPIALECCLKADLNPQVVRFAIPVAISIIKLGAASYLSVITLFAAQLQNADIGAGQYLSITCMAVVGATASAGVPFAGVILLTLILTGLGLSLRDVGILLAADFIPDRGSTVTNVLGACLVTALLDKWNRKFLEEQTNEPESETAASLPPESEIPFEFEDK